MFSFLSAARHTGAGLLLLCCIFFQAYGQPSSNGHDYRFTVLYYGLGGVPDWENSFNTPEKNLQYFDPVKRAFHSVGAPVGQHLPASRLNTPAGLGIRMENGDLANSFGYPVRALSKTYTSFNVFDSTGVSVIALGINPDNAPQFEYRLVLDDHAVVKDWGPFSQFKKVPETGYQYADLGRLCWPGHYLLIETRHRQSLVDAGSMIVNWPENPAIYLAGTRIYYLEDNAIGMNGFIDTTLVKLRHASHKDRGTGVLQHLRLPGDKEYTYMIFDLKNIALSFSYKAVLVRHRRGVVDSIDIEHYFNDIYLRVESRLFDQPGTYQLIVGNVYFFGNPAYEHWLLNIPFEVLPVPVLAKKWSLLQLLPYIGGSLALLGLAGFLYYRWNASRLRNLQRTQQLKQSQLRGLQHQLNPHFLFNALSAIQNLIGKNEVRQASQYLDRFSALTRTVLETSGHELISLEDELAMMQAYLEMEQLRTPFSFTIELAGTVDATNTEIPGMLLQPYVENAVKHGVIGRSDGYISLLVGRENDTLIFTISDNGRGMEDTAPRNGSTGKGLAIVKKRIELLNELYGAPLISTAIHTNAAGTIITIQLQHWLDKTSSNA